MPLKKIEREKRQEQHLFYTSFKYTKTGELIVSVMKKMVDVTKLSIELALQHAKKRKLITVVPKTPLEQLDAIRKIFKKDKEVIEFLEFYEIIRNIDKYKKITEKEFRKGITLKIFINEEVLTVNMQKFEEIQKNFENFIKVIENFLLTK
ncbi:MAG: hypothetical protein QW244_01625 [Candidatus Pacearchaeota archaeon]